VSESTDHGRRLAKDLRDRYNVKGILITAVEQGYITELRCGMPYCFASARGHFDPLDVPLGPWMPTHEHFPLAKRHKGIREVTNAVLAHRRCNNIGYKLEELAEFLEAYRLDDGSRLRPGAIAAAIGDNVQQRGMAGGLCKGPRKRAIRIALETHELIERSR
jgi:hypothetical protein